MELQDGWRRSRHVVGVPPRSLYGEVTESEAWRSAMLMARGRVQPTYLFANRRILGVTVGRSPFSEDVAVHRFRHGTPWSEMERVREDMLRCAFPDYNAIINACTNLQFGRTYFGKAASSAPVATNWYDLWPVAGVPAAGAINGTAFTANQFTDASVGAINHRGNVSPATKHLFSKWAYTTANTMQLLLYDRVLSYDQCTFNANANKTLTNTLTAQRYNSGAPGLLIACVTNTVTGSTATTLTQLRYTNQAGTTLQSMPTTPTMTFIPSAAAPSATLGARAVLPSVTGTSILGPYLPLAQGDTGCQLINDFTTSAANTGSLTFVLLHPLAELVLPVAAIVAETDNIFQVAELERIYDGACLAIMNFVATATAFVLTGSVKYGWGP